MFWNKQKTDTSSTESGYDQGFWDYVESASVEVSEWSDWKKEGWSLLKDSDRSYYASGYEAGKKDHEK